MCGPCLVLLFSLLLTDCCFADCPGGWTAHEGSCYLYFHERYTFFEAKVTCDFAKGRLVEITSNSENQFVKNMATNNRGSSVWLGIEDFVVEGEFVMASSQDHIAYSSWASGEPNDWGHSEDCVVLSEHSGQWSDDFCEARHNFVCEQEMISEDIVG